MVVTIYDGTGKQVREPPDVDFVIVKFVTDLAAKPVVKCLGNWCEIYVKQTIEINTAEKLRFLMINAGLLKVCLR